jgi:hypothetical protein
MDPPLLSVQMAHCGGFGWTDSNMIPEQRRSTLGQRLKNSDKYGKQI